MAGTVGNIVIEPCTVYLDGVDIGFTEGDIEINPEEQSVDVTTHQTGTNVNDALRTGNTVGFSLTLKEANVAAMTTLLGYGGEAATATAEVTSITCTADVSGSLNNKYFLINSALDAIGYYVWFNVNSLGVDPAVSGRTAVPITLATNATAAQVATAVAAALDALAAFVSTSSGAVVTVTNASTGSTTDASAGTATTFTVSVTTQGYGTLIGWGSSKQFQSMLANAKKMVLHPLRVASTVYTSDLTFWKAYLSITSINHSGENPKTVTVDVRVFHDATRPSTHSLFALGDSR